MPIENCELQSFLTQNITCNGDFNGFYFDDVITIFKLFYDWFILFKSLSTIIINSQDYTFKYSKFNT